MCSFGKHYRVKNLASGFFFLIVSILTTSPCTALIGDSDGAFGLDGSIRSIGSFIQNYESPVFFGPQNDNDTSVQTLLRLTAAGRPNDSLSYEIHLVQSHTYFSQGGSSETGGFGLTVNTSRYRALDDTLAWHSNEKNQALLWLDRFNLKIALPNSDITLGRQAISFGKAYFWNPMDVFLPFDPRQFDRDYKAGVDAVRADIALGDFSGFTVVGVLGRELDQHGNYLCGDQTWHTSWYGSSILMRYFSHLHGWDFAFQGGKVYGGYHLGGGIVGEIEGLELRGEASSFFAHNSPSLLPPQEGNLFEDHLLCVAGLGFRFENSLMVEAEYLFNGGGESRDFTAAFARFKGGSILQMGRHLAGVFISYDITPIIIGQIASLYSFSDSSGQVQPALKCSLSDNAELLVGAGINWGRRPVGDTIENLSIKSEFGTFPNDVFIEIKYYF